MRRHLAFLAALALAGTFAFPSVAAPLAWSSADAVGGDVQLTPTGAPNGQYAYLTEDDELVVDLTAANPRVEGDGVNADAVTTIGNVFRVRYNGSRSAEVWLTHGSDAVTFYAEGHPIQRRADNVTLGPNETVTVGLAVDTTGPAADGLLDDVTVHARLAEPEDVGAADDDGGTFGLRNLDEGDGTATPAATPRPTGTPEESPELTASPPSTGGDPGRGERNARGGTPASTPTESTPGFRGASGFGLDRLGVVAGGTAAAVTAFGALRWFY